MMGVNITGGHGCGVQDSEVAGNGDAGVVLAGGDRVKLLPSNHFVVNCTVHHNHRWILNYSPDVMLAGVGQSVVDSEVFGSPQIAIFFQVDVGICILTFVYLGSGYVYLFIYFV